MALGSGTRSNKTTTEDKSEQRQAEQQIPSRKTIRDANGARRPKAGLCRDDNQRQDAGPSAGLRTQNARRMPAVHSVACPATCAFSKGRSSDLINEDPMSQKNSTGSFACVFRRRHGMLNEARFCAEIERIGETCKMTSAMQLVGRPLHPGDAGTPPSTLRWGGEEKANRYR